MSPKFPFPTSITELIYPKAQKYSDESSEGNEVNRWDRDKTWTWRAANFGDLLYFSVSLPSHTLKHCHAASSTMNHKHRAPLKQMWKTFVFTLPMKHDTGAHSTQCSTMIVHSLLPQSLSCVKTVLLFETLKVWP